MANNSKAETDLVTAEPQRCRKCGGPLTHRNRRGFCRLKRACQNADNRARYIERVLAADAGARPGDLVTSLRPCRHGPDVNHRGTET